MLFDRSALHNWRIVRRINLYPLTFISRRAYWCSALIAIVALVAATLNLLDETGQLSYWTAEMDRLEHPVPVGQTNLEAQSDDVATDFPKSFPASVQMREVLGEIERSTAANSVAFDGIQRQDHNRDDRQLGCSNLSLALRGGYPQAKAVILDVLERFPNITLTQWRMHRETLPVGGETTITLAVWCSPMSESSPVQPFDAVRH